MIAIPIKTDDTNSALAPLFGKAKWFAFIDEKGEVSVEKNAYEGGIKVARWFASRGVTTLITNHLGEKPFHALNESGIKIYCASEKRTTIEEALEAFRAGMLPEVSVINYIALLGEEEGHSHKGACHHGHQALFKTKLKCCEKKGMNPLASH